ncbi:hypothetical protein PUR71_07000 [Streptomyces sp. SP17BM10]|uniref:hypothetical protein n=1 Tax=Streptomyces sp. SP17BM10 TaxID=3002530 RepID=UPI002E78391A|nr:hypothetical protein [Streptomyces sp. SP17BM10]MEE1782670.1 hypothetical protein [Streptomyces sp. SP17BM10]
MRDQAQARQAALDQQAVAKEEILRQHYNRLREPEEAHRPCVEDEEALARTARAREALARRPGGRPRSRRPAAHQPATLSGAA